jgi:predicted HTH domain antitoxin
MSVMSVRLKDSEMQRIEELAAAEDKEKSTVVRDLINLGWSQVMVRRYREGRVSLGTLAEKLDLSLGETIELLAESGVRAPISYDDYLEGFGVLAAADQPRRGKPGRGKA